MNYNTAKKQFEFQVERMQADLKEYASQVRASQKVIDTRMEMINAFVDFYNMAEKMAEELEWQLLNTGIAMSKLHVDTQKLVHWCYLHRLTVSNVFYYTESELEDLVKKKVDFTQMSFPGCENPEYIRWKYEMVKTYFGPPKPQFAEQPKKPTREQIKEQYHSLLFTFHTRPQPYAE